MRDLDLLPLTEADFVAQFESRYAKGLHHARALYRHFHCSGNWKGFEQLPQFLKSPKLVEALHNDLTFAVAPIVRQVQEGDPPDQTIKFCQKLHDGLETESVLIPMGRWQTLCISSQVGCKMGCTFCETAQMGLLRNLSALEILGQVYAARHVLKAPFKNIVFMGMGEPFDNFDSVLQVIKVLTDREGFKFQKGQITVSTVGRVDGIKRLAETPYNNIHLAISINAPNDELRSQIMPVNRSVPLAELQAALVSYPKREGRRFFIEYVLLKGVNDTFDHAMQLVEFVKHFRATINIIPYNPRRNSPFQTPSDKEVDQFAKWIHEAGQFVKRRITRGRSQMAACGQLGNRELRKVKREG